MDHLIQDGTETTTITFRNELSIQSAREIQRILCEAISAHQTVKVRLENIEILDLSCIQLFCAAHKTAFQANKQMSFDTALSEAVIRTLEQAGFHCLKTCGNNGDKACPMMRRADG